MSREQVQQVWLPSSGVWAALPGQPGDPGDRLNALVGAGPRQHSPAGDAGSKLSQKAPGPARSDLKRRRKQSSDPGSGQQQRRRRQKQQAPPSPAAAVAAAPRITGFELQHSDVEASDVDEDYELPPTCPICLLDIMELADKAVVAPCMHTFCHPCISRWLEHHKRLCPLCKDRVGSVLYDITPTGAHKERQVPLSPKLVTVDGGSAAADGAPLLQRLQNFLGVAGLLDPFPQQQQQRRRLRWQGGRLQLHQESGSGRSSFSSRGRATAGSAAVAAGGGGHAAQEAAAAAGWEVPRPYFWRLQQRMQAGGYRPDGGSGPGGRCALHRGAATDEPVTEADYVLLWRRQVYDQDMWAEPLGAEAARISLGSSSAWERRLTDWIDRELHALLQTDDVTIIRGFILGLVVAYGIEPPTCSDAAAAAAAAGGAVGSAGASSRDVACHAAVTTSRHTAEMVAAAGGRASVGALSSSPAEALRPFLYEHSAHFWHELRCFATAPFNLRTYDRMVRYVRYDPLSGPSPLPQPQQQPPPPQQQQRTMAPTTQQPPLMLPRNQPVWPRQQRTGSTARQASRWDQGHFGGAPQVQQAQQPEGSSRRVEPARVECQGGGGSNVRRRRRTGEGISSGNPSPLPLMPALAASSPGDPQKQQQQPVRGSDRDGDLHSRRGHSRSRSRSASRQWRWPPRHRSHSGDRRWQDRRSVSRISGTRHYARRSRSRNRSRSRGGRYSSPEHYLTGADDGGDRWGMC